MNRKQSKESSDRDRPRRKAKPRQFTLLPEDIEQIESLRSRYQKLALAKSDKPADIVKSEIVRAGIYALRQLNDNQFFKTVEKLEVLKEGRQAKNETEEK